VSGGRRGRAPSLRGRSVWVIGASSGIGAALAQALVEQGCRVAISARSEDALREVAKGAMAVVPVDITDREGLVEAARHVSTTMDGLDVVIVTAGYWKQMSATHFDVDDFSRHIEVNVLGMANAVAAVLPIMQAQRHGTIVGVSSVAGYRGMPGAEGYGPSKAAQLNFLESLRLGLKGTGVSVQIVSPGFVRTEMTSTNTFPMPFIISAEAAAHHIIRGLVRGKDEIVFPLPMAITMKIARIIPHALWTALFAGRSEK
jgi:short-subunit dehydrogenase